MLVRPEVVETLIAIEVMLIGVIIVMTYFLKMIYYFREKKRQELMNEIQDFFNQLIIRKAAFVESDFKTKWRKLYLIMPLLPKLNKLFSPYDHWLTLKDNFLKTVVLSLTKRAAMKKDWIMRCYAAEAMTILPVKIEEKYLMKLIEDKIPVIHLNAINAAIVQGAENAIGLIIKQMSHERKMSQASYLQAFDNPPKETRLMVEKHLLSLQDVYERASCYTILLKYPEKKLTWDIAPDILSANKELKMAALRYLSFADPEKALLDATKLLEDPVWEVRVSAIHVLSSLHKDESLKPLANCLRDPVWWVRINAAQVLFKFGAKGIEILKAQDPAVDKFSYDVAKQVLSTVS